MTLLSVHRMKPNPMGKDRNDHGSPSPAQLGAEWVDVRNHRSMVVNSRGVSLYRLAYPETGERTAAFRQLEQYLLGGRHGHRK